MSDTTTQDESIFDDSDVEEISTEQVSEDLEANDGSEVNKGYAKHVTKTNQSLSDHEELMGYLFEADSPKGAVKKIREENPNLADRLSKHKKFSSLFTKTDDQVQSNEQDEDLVKKAVGEIVVEGKYLSLADRQVVKKNPTFNKILKGFVSSGYSVEEASERAFKEAFPSKANMVETSFLSSPSEVTTQKRQSPEDLMARKFMDPNTFPPDLRKRMKK